MNIKRKSFQYIVIIGSIIAFTASCQFFSPDNQQSVEKEEGVTAPRADKGNVDDVEIVATNFYRDRFDNWRVYGLLTNVANYPVVDIEVEVEIFDASGSSVYKESEPVGSAGIVPGESAPFSVYVEEDLPSVEQVSVTVESLYKAEFESAQVEISATNVDFSENGAVLITGEIANSSVDAAILKQIATAIFSPEGEILFAGECDICVRYLAPGETGPFQFFIFGYATDIDASSDIRFYISSELMAPLETLEVSLSEQEYTFTDALNLFHVIGEIQNDSGEILDIYLLNTLYDSDGNVISVSSYNILPASLAPGESAPYDITFGDPSIESAIDKETVTWKSQLDYYLTRAVDDVSVELKTTSDGYEFSDSMGTFSGTVLNNTGEELQVVLVVVGLRDKNTGNLVGLGRELIWGEVPDGGSIEYTIHANVDTNLNTSTLEPFLIVRGR